MVSPVPKRRQTPLAQQLRRTAELDAIRLQRRLTPDEQAEADRLADAHYQRVWRAEQTARESRLAGALR